MKTDININNPGDLDQFRSVARKRKQLNCSRRSDSDSRLSQGTSKTDCHWSQVSSADLKHFLSLLSDPVIKAFHAHDTCCLVSDQYLISMVFVYFKKAKLEHEEYR